MSVSGSSAVSTVGNPIQSDVLVGDMEEESGLQENSLPGTPVEKTDPPVPVASSSNR